MSILHKLNWRYAVQKFDSTRIVPESDITELLRATNLSASTFGLQPYEYIVVHNKELQKKLQIHSYNQKQISEASHLIILAVKTEINQEYIYKHIHKLETQQKLQTAALNDHQKLINDFLYKKTPAEFVTWAEKQVHLALGTLLVAAADIKVDTFHLELVDTAVYDSILDLEKHGLHTSAVVAIGYRARGDEISHIKKIQKPLNEMVRLYY